MLSTQQRRHTVIENAGWYVAIPLVHPIQVVVGPVLDLALGVEDHLEVGVELDHGAGGFDVVDRDVVARAVTYGSPGEPRPASCEAVAEAAEVDDALGLPGVMVQRGAGGLEHRDAVVVVVAAQKKGRVVPDAVGDREPQHRGEEVALGERVGDLDVDVPEAVRPDDCGGMATTSLVVQPAVQAGTRRGVSLLAWSGAAVLAAVFATLSLLRHARLLTTGYDLGIFEQSVRSYAQGRLPTSLLKGIDYPLLGDHFSPVVGLLGSVYSLVPRAEVLLIAQALLLAVGAVPLVSWAGRAFGAQAATVILLCYGLAGGLAHAVAFDFHEVAFAVPLLAFSLCSLGQRRLRTAAAWAAPLVLVKEDLGITVATIGVIIALIASSRTDRRLGLLTGNFGVVATSVETLIIIPTANPAGANQYTHQLAFDTAIGQAATFFSSDLKITTLVLLLLPTAFIALRSPLLVAALPTLAWRFLSDNPHYWGTAFHYDAVRVPIVSAAFVDGLVRMRRNRAGTAARQRGALLVRPCC